MGTAEGTFRGFPVKELIEDLRRAHTSRCLDDREIALQKQSRVFFQISGAGHEALLLGLARSLRRNHFGIDVLELGVTIGMLRALVGLAVRLPAVAERRQ
jgi:hypothetical protein